MRSVLKTISLKEGMQVVLRCTPSVYGIAKRNGYQIKGEPTQEETTAAYIILAYFAAMNEWEIQAFDDPSIGKFPYTLADFDTWAWTNMREFQEFVEFFIEAITGKKLTEIVEGSVKKKTTTRKKGLIGWITNLLKRSS